MHKYFCQGFHRLLSQLLDQIGDIHLYAGGVADIYLAVSVCVRRTALLVGECYHVGDSHLDIGDVGNADIPVVVDVSDATTLQMFIADYQLTYPISEKIRAAY